MNTPYFNTYLSTKVSLYANQMDNDIYKHLKDNLIKKLQGKCYKSFGYISKIYKIDQILGNNIVHEDPSASAIFNVKFSCKLCKPLKNTTIVAEVHKINKNIIALRDGPIHILILEGSGHINETNFLYDEKIGSWLAKLGNEKGMKIVSGSYVKIKVIDLRIENNSNRIIVIGVMDSMASEKEINELLQTREKDDIKFQEYDTLDKEQEQEASSEASSEADSETDSEESSKSSSDSGSEDN
jgi:DNA-directed RNA polymerase subunit E'/Rpb7